MVGRPRAVASGYPKAPPIRSEQSSPPSPEPGSGDGIPRGARDDPALRCDEGRRDHDRGRGLAGCEAAWQAARRGLDVVLYEMKPERRRPAHALDDFAELVCSNSLRSNGLANAVGLLKEEMRRLGSLILEAADETAVPAGRALAVDRDGFRARHHRTHRRPTRASRSRRERVDAIPDADPVVLATGPLTAPELAADLQRAPGRGVSLLLRRHLPDRLRRLDRPRRSRSAPRATARTARATT